MKNSILLSLVIASLMIPVVRAQDDPYGVVDTVRIATVSTEPGSSVSVDVYIFNDPGLSSLTVPIKFNQEFLTLDTIRFDGSKIEYLSMKPFLIDNENGKVLLGGLVIMEDPIPAGPGLLATLDFSVSSGANPGDVFVLDTSFVPPAGYFIFVPVDLDKFAPEFVAGELRITDPNKPPIFKVIDDLSVFEGKEISFVVEAVDQNGIEYSALRLPPGAEFDENTGLFSWIPPFVGPYSSSAGSVSARFSATDGQAASHIQVDITILNTNRPPELAVPDSVDVVVGDSVFILISAEDPDIEDVEVDLSNLPTGANYLRGNPGYLSWKTSLSDSGSYLIDVSAFDPYGSSDHKTLKLNVHAAAPCELDISDIQVVSGEAGIIEVDLLNRVAVDGMNLLIKYDPTALDYLSSSAVGTRIEYWERFIVTVSEPDGRIWLDANANFPGQDLVDPLAEGSGPVMLINFLITSDVSFAGQMVPVVFEFIDTLSNLDNIIIDSDGEVLGWDMIDYFDGSVFIKQFEALVGDINLNYVPFEVGDVVYFTNYFIDPGTYPLDGDRWPNSDINQDGRPGTIGDLIQLISIVGVGGSGKLYHPEPATDDRIILENIRTATGSDVIADGSSPIGGAMFLFKVDAASELDVTVGCELDHVTLHHSLVGDELRVLLLDESRAGIAADGRPIVSVRHSVDVAVELIGASVADPTGRMLTAELGRSAVLPSGYRLDQNFPNPFNPVTQISFSLERAGMVSLKVYNIHGQLLRTLVSLEMQAGVHSIEWDGADADGDPVASGVYFYRLESLDFSDVKKMMLIK
jgi:hypothetical protein